MGNAPTLTEKSKQMSKHLFREVPCRRDPVILSLSGKFLDSAWTHAQCEPGFWTLLANENFLCVGHSRLGFSNSLKISTIALFPLTTAIALVKTLEFLKQAGSVQLLVARSFPLECQLNYLKTVWHSAVSDTLLQTLSSWGVPVR